jgi:NlpC/P60 family putative phage cell wall peptidase
METSEWRIANSEWNEGKAGEETLFATRHSPFAGDIVAIARSWIGTPYVHQAGLKHVGCDCLGLLRGIWRELYGEEPEETPPYSLDWAEATGAETLYRALKRHVREVVPKDIATGDIALFRMTSRAPAKHCGIVSARDGVSTLIHARQNKRVSEEPLSAFWRSKLAFAFRI